MSRDNLLANLSALRAELSGVECAAVVKADAYGHGAPVITRWLLDEGCRTFFVANVLEAASIAAPITESGGRVYVFNGVGPETAGHFVELGARPVLNSLDEVALWARRGRGRPAALHLDTGFNRLGLSHGDVDDVASYISAQTFPVELVMSHLACADNPLSQGPEVQLRRFAEQLCGAKGTRRSIANSAAVFRGAEFHLDLARPGLALYGGQPISKVFLPLKPVGTFLAPVLQVRKLKPGDEVGYGASFTAAREMRVATLGAGYADGVPVSLSNRGIVAFEEFKCPVIGRVSMDSMVVDISALPERITQPGSWAQVFGDAISIDEQADAAGTLAYEMLCRVGGRTQRFQKPL